MADYFISFARSARKELEKLPADVAEKILARIEALTENPRPVGVIKLHGQRNLWRMRIGNYRLIYSIDDFSKTIDVSVIRHRKEVYRDL